MQAEEEQMNRWCDEGLSSCGGSQVDVVKNKIDLNGKVAQDYHMCWKAMKQGDDDGVIRVTRTLDVYKLLLKFFTQS